MPNARSGRNSLQSQTLAAPSPKNMTYGSRMHAPQLSAMGATGGPNNGLMTRDGNALINLQELVSASCSFYEEMEKKKEGSIETMLDELRSKIAGGKVKLDVRVQYDPNR